MSLAGDLRDTVDAFAALVSSHLRLARLELARDAGAIGAQVAKIAALAPLLLVGYGFLCIALALFLKRFLAPDLAFLLVGLVNFAIAGIGIWHAAQQLKNRAMLMGTMEELERSTTALAVRRSEVSDGQ